MKCSNCSKEVFGFNQVCPNCGNKLFEKTENIVEAEKEIKTEEKSKNEKRLANPVYYLAVIVAFFTFVLGLYEIAQSNIITGIIYWASGTVTTILLSGFGNVINLLEDISIKLDK